MIMIRLFKKKFLKNTSVFVVKNIFLTMGLFVGLLHFIYAGEGIPVANVSIEFWIFCFVILYLSICVINLSVNVVCDKYCSVNFSTKRNKFFIMLAIIIILMVAWYQFTAVAF